MINFTHSGFAPAGLLAETGDLFSSFSVLRDESTSTSCAVTYISQDGSIAHATLSGTAFLFVGNQLKAGQISGITFDSPADGAGTMSGFALKVSQLERLLDSAEGVETWLMKQDWSSQWPTFFQPASDALAGTTVGDGLDFNMRGNDYFQLSGRADRFYSGGGNDILYGDNGNDTLQGGAGNDTIKGGRDNDAVQGGLGNDQLYGSSGNDKLTGGAGDDEFSYELDYGDAGLSLGGTDKIVDFTDHEDRIYLELASIGVTGMQAIKILDQGVDTLIKVHYSIGGERLVQAIRLLDFDHTNLSGDDFIFA